LAGGPVEWNRSLLRVRKSGKLPRLRERPKKPEVRPIDLYRFASEVALQQLSVEFRATLDGILCDPKLAAKFDELAQSFSPGYSSFEYRWAALTLRKRAVLARRMAQDQCEWLHRKLPRPRSMSGANWSRHNYPGIYLLVSRSRQPLYVGEAANVRWRLDLVSQTPSWQRLEPASATLIRKDHKRVGLQSILISRVHPLMNLQSLALDPEVVR